MTNLCEQAAVITASFSDYRFVKTRGVVQLVFEVPVEFQAKAFEILGFPQPGQEAACAIARLAPTAQPLTGRVDEGSGRGTPTSSPSKKAMYRYSVSTDMEKARDRAGMLASDIQFQKWIGCDGDEHVTAAYIRRRCGIASRSQIAVDADAYDAFVELETDYKIATGQIAEQRR